MENKYVILQEDGNFELILTQEQQEEMEEAFLSDKGRKECVIQKISFKDNFFNIELEKKK